MEPLQPGDRGFIWPSYTIQDHGTRFVIVRYSEESAAVVASAPLLERAVDMVRMLRRLGMLRSYAKLSERVIRVNHSDNRHRTRARS